MRRLCPLTRSAVSARSSGVESGICTLSICLQMSTAMMSAPSCAIRTAWARPWPRAAPVMKATLPSTRPVISNLNSSLAERISLDRGGHGIPAADSRCRGECRVGHVHIPLGEPLQDLLQRDPALQPGQCRAEAVVGSHAEGQVLPHFAMDVENISVGRELAMVAHSSADQHHHRASLGHRLVVDFDIAGDIARYVWCGRLETQ